ncbi:MAG TPA: glycosyltransferase family 2 protein [Segetibacter sp.]
MNANPIVSVLITAYNRESYIAEAIESVLASTFDNWEMIIVDDCSTDSTVSIAKQFEKQDERVKVFVNEKNLGQFQNRNKAASYAKGKYLKYLDSDDMILTDGLCYCVYQMEMFPTASIGLITFDKKVQGPTLFPSHLVIKEHFFINSSLHIGPTGTIIRRDFFESNNGFDARFEVTSDNYFNIQMAIAGDVVFMPYQFFYYRRHEGQEINNSLGYLIYNFLYSKELFNSGKLPLSREEVTFLKRKLQKRHSVNLVRHSLSTGSLKDSLLVMEKTGYSLWSFFKGFFY